LRRLRSVPADGSGPLETESEARCSESSASETSDRKWHGSDAHSAWTLSEFITETIDVLGTDAQEVLVERAKPLRNNAGPNEGALVTQFNDSMLQQQS